MGELVIKEHNFKTAKSKIQEYASKAPKNVPLPRVREDGGFLNWGDHKVTGTEFNQCVGQIQDSLISLNHLSKTFISEFTEIYNAFEALDKDYISGIMVAVEAAVKSSDDAKKVSDQNRKTIDALQKIVEKLRGFENEVRTDLSTLKVKADLNGEKKIQHFEDIDSIWEDVHNHQGILSDVNSQINSIQGALLTIDQFLEALKGLRHLLDIDILWNDLQNHYASYKGFYDACIEYKNKVDASVSTINTIIDDFRHSVDGLTEHINIVNTRVDQYTEETYSMIAHIRDEVQLLSDYSDKLKSYGHLEEVDKMWEDLQDLSKTHQEFRKDYEGFTESMATSFGSLSENVAAISSEVARHYDRLSAIDSELKAINEKIDSEQVKMSHRIRVNHIIVAFSVVLVIVLFVLEILNII